MRESIFSAVFGAMSNEVQMDMISNNLANVNTTAYKKDNVAFHDTFMRFAHDYMCDARTYLREEHMFPSANVMARPRLSDERTDFTQGNLQETGNPLDFALVGNGFFKVRTPDGDYLTRAGSFQLSSDGTLITEQGYQVLGSGGPITLPGGAAPEVDSRGTIRVNGEVIGAFDLVQVPDLSRVEKVGNNLYRVGNAEENAEAAPQDMSVQQGMLERGNVNVVEEMVAMIHVQRMYQMYQKMMTGTTQMDQKMIQTVGQPR